MARLRVLHLHLLCDMSAPSLSPPPLFPSVTYFSVTRSLPSRSHTVLNPSAHQSNLTLLSPPPLPTKTIESG